MPFVDFGLHMQRLSLVVGTDYRQFSLCDAQYESDVEEFTDESMARRLLAGRNQVLILTVRPMTAPVQIEVREQDPGYAAEQWDHIAECSFEVESGELEVVASTDGQAASLRVTPGMYRVRAHFGKLDSVDESGLEGDDHYLLVLWPAPSGEPVVLKQWPEHFGTTAASKLAAEEQP